MKWKTGALSISLAGAVAFMSAGHKAIGLAFAIPLALWPARRDAGMVPDLDPSPNAERALITRLTRPDSRDPLSYYDIAKFLARAANQKDGYTSTHCERTAEYAVTVGRELDMSAKALDRLRLAALLHDIGKLRMRSFLLSKPGLFTVAERKEMCTHTLQGADMLRGIPSLYDLLPAIALHHECWDGTGYPHGLSGENIPLQARIISVVDTYDALTSARPYQSPVTPDRACEIIQGLSGSRLSPEVVAAFMRAFERGAFDTANIASHLRPAYLMA